MTCPQCGYVLSSFDKTCPRCEEMKKRQAQQTPPVQPTVEQPVAAPTPVYCSRCGMANAAAASFCPRCGNSLFQVTSLPVHVQPSPPPQLQQPINVTVNASGRKSNAGWWVALFTLLFATPLGCVTIPVALVVIIAIFAVGAPFIEAAAMVLGIICVLTVFVAPLIVTTIAIVTIAKKDIPREAKARGIAIAFSVGIVVWLVWFWVIGRIVHSFPK